MPIRKGVELSDEDAAKYDALIEDANYYDRLQYVYKIKLNSIYGALLNAYFRFYDDRMGQSTTATGRQIVTHQARQINKIFEDKYDVEFPLYADPDECHFGGKTALHGDYFKGKHESDCILYGDTDSVSSDTLVNINGVTQSIEMHFQRLASNRKLKIGNDGKELLFCDGYDTSLNLYEGQVIQAGLFAIYRHWVKWKDRFELTTTSNNSVKVTGDHSLLIISGGEIIPVTSREVQVGNKMWELDENGKPRITTVRSIKMIREFRNEYVYDLVMCEEANPYFFANNILVHNSCYFRTYAKNKEEAIKIGDAIAEKVNKSFPDFMRTKFLCHPGFDHLISAGREIVSDRGIFVTKKRYILHIVDNEGQPEDKIKVMGLDTKKTTLPREIANNINKFVENLLKGMSEEEFIKQILDYKHELRNSENILELGLPKGVKKVEYYTRAFEADGKTRLPGHVAAAIHYNLCLKMFGDLESPPIISGSKIKVFYLKGKYGRFKSIAIPTDSEYPPDWFLEHFKIDYDAHIERLVDAPLQHILTAINKNVPNKQTEFVKSVITF